MLSGRLTQTTLRALDWLSAQLLPPDKTAGHLQTGRRGEEAAYFYLRRHGYTVIARNFRSPNHRGELDLVGWVREKGKSKDQNNDILCFIEVKLAPPAPSSPPKPPSTAKSKTTSATSPATSSAIFPARIFPASPPSASTF